MLKRNENQHKHPSRELFSEKQEGGQSEGGAEPALPWSPNALWECRSTSPASAHLRVWPGPSPYLLLQCPLQGVHSQLLLP